MHNIVSTSCTNCKKTAIMFVKPILMGNVGFSLNHLDDLCKVLDVYQIQSLYENMLYNWFNCDHCQTRWQFVGNDTITDRKKLAEELFGK